MAAERRRMPNRPVRRGHPARLLLLLVIAGLTSGTSACRRAARDRITRPLTGEVDGVNLIVNGTFEGGPASWTAPFFDGTNWRSDVVSLATVANARPGGDGSTALEVTVRNVPPELPPYLGGAQGLTTKDLGGDKWYRVAFDARRTDPAGSSVLTVTRIWGGGEATPVRLTDS